MALRTRLDLRQIQRLGLSTRVLASLHILRLSAADLAEALAREAETNPFLLPGLPPPMMVSPGPAQGDTLDTLAAAAPSWQEGVLRQIAQQPLAPALMRAAAMLVGELDERGWLDTPLDLIAAETGVDLSLLEQALTVVQGCDPPGVGARGREESLSLQLTDMGLSLSDARATLAELPLFARRDWPVLARKLGLNVDQVMARAALLRRVSPDPVSGATGPVPVLRPDLVVIRDGLGAPSVALATDHVPRPTIDLKLVRQIGAAPEGKPADGFGGDLLERARAMVRAVESRAGTLLKIGQWLVQRQDAALRQGPGFLRAASRIDCARDLGLHPSTVGRAVAGKALQADGKVWPLSALFSAPAPGTAAGPKAGIAPGMGGQGVQPPPPAAARAIAHRIAVLIAAEPAARPRSDGEIVQILGAEGVDIARRTVAKYRSGLRIPPAHLRRTRG